MRMKIVLIIFQQLMNAVITEIIGNKYLIYLDDIIVDKKNLGDYNKKLSYVFELLRKHNLKVQSEICEF